MIYKADETLFLAKQKGHECHVCHENHYVAEEIDREDNQTRRFKQATHRNKRCTVHVCAWREGRCGRKGELMIYTADETLFFAEQRGRECQVCPKTVLLQKRQTEQTITQGGTNRRHTAV